MKVSELLKHTPTIHRVYVSYFWSVRWFRFNIEGANLGLEMLVGATGSVLGADQKAASHIQENLIDQKSFVQQVNFPTCSSGL